MGRRVDTVNIVKATVIVSVLALVVSIVGATFAWISVRAAKRSADAAESSADEARRLRTIETDRRRDERRPLFDIYFEEVGQAQYYLLCAILTSAERID